MKRLAIWSWQFAIMLGGYAAGIGGLSFFLGSNDELQTFFAEHRAIGGSILAICYVLYILRRRAEHDLKRLRDKAKADLERDER